MVALSPQSARTAEFFARLTTASAALHLDPAPLIQRCQFFGDSAGEFARVSSTQRFDRLAVACMRPAATDNASHLAPEGVNFLEFELKGEEVRIVDHVLGRCRIADVLGRIRVGAVGDEVIDELKRYLAILAPTGEGVGLSSRYEPEDARFWLLHTEQGSDEVSLQRILAVAEIMNVTEAQRTFVDNAHRLLAQSRPVIASLEARRSGVEATLALSYQRVNLERLARMLGAIYEEQVAAKLGHLAGAFNRDEASSVVFLLGGADPMDIRVSLDYRGVN